MDVDTDVGAAGEIVKHTFSQLFFTVGIIARKVRGS